MSGQVNIGWRQLVTDGSIRFVKLEIPFMEGEANERRTVVC